MFRKYLIILSAIFLFTSAFAGEIKIPNLDKGYYKEQKVYVPLFHLIELTTGINSDQLKNIDDIVNVTQKNWLDKDISIDKKVNDNSQQIKSIAKELGFIDSIYPSEYKKYDAILVLGAKYKTMKERVIFLKNLFNNNKIKSRSDIYLLGSDRPITKKEFTNLNKEKFLLTENNLLLDLTDKYSLNYYGNIINVNSICEHTGHRCTRDDTLKDLIKFYGSKISNYQNILVISNQPYINYQDKVVRYFLYKNGKKATIDSVGAKAYSDIHPSLILQSIAKDLYMYKKLNYNN